MASRIGAFVLHSGAAAVMAHGWTGLQSLTISKWINTQKGGHFQFLTILGYASMSIVVEPILSTDQAGCSMVVDGIEYCV